MKISIITAVYNRADTIERAIRSVMSQTYPKIEHIVIDGGSTDGTVERLRANFRDNIILVSEQDMGIYDALNKGINLASGDVIGFLHSDDYFANDGVLDVVSQCFRDESIDGIYGDVDYFSKEAPEKIIRHYSSARFSPKLLSWGWMPAHTTLYLRRGIYEKYGHFKTDYRIAADFEFICRIFTKGEIGTHYIPAVLVKMQAGGVSTNGVAAKIRLNQEVLRACRENGLNTNIFKILSKYPVKLSELFRR